jgi:hypothetical protein
MMLSIHNLFRCFFREPVPGWYVSYRPLGPFLEDSARFLKKSRGILAGAPSGANGFAL